MIVIVGDRPSSKNEDFDIAFVGTESGKRLFRLLGQIEMPSFIIINAYDFDGNELTIPDAEVYIALGIKAANRLKGLNKKFHKLPHPSPRNRYWNKKDAETKFLESVKEIVKSCL